jgi:hypothetical protein
VPLRVSNLSAANLRDKKQNHHKQNHYEWASHSIQPLSGLAELHEFDLVVHESRIARFDIGNSSRTQVHIKKDQCGAAKQFVFALLVLF